MSFENIPGPKRSIEKLVPGKELDPSSERLTSILELRLEHAEKVLDGSLVFGETVLNDLKYALNSIRTARIEVGMSENKAEEAIRELPIAEIHNILERASRYHRDNDPKTAKVWHDLAIDRMQYWNSQGVVPPGMLKSLEKAAVELNTRQVSGTSSTLTDTE